MINPPKYLAQPSRAGRPCYKVIPAVVTLLLACPLTLSQTTAPSARGLDALPDDALLYELTTRQLTPLIDRYLEQRKLPDAQRQKIRAVIDAMHTLSSPELTTRDRDAALGAINANADATLDAFKDPRFFLQLSNLLIRTTLDPDSRTLEYWGSNARVQVALRPSVATTLKLLERAAAEATRQRDAVAAQITQGNQEAMTARYVKLDTLATTAEYTRQMSAYYLALALDPAAAGRKAICESAIEALQQFDTPDSQVQPTVRLRLAKLHLLAGHFDEAQKLLTSIADNPDKQIVPEPDLSQQFDARYFLAVAELSSDHFAEAETAITALRTWIGQTIPADNAAARKGAEAACAIFDYRLLSARASAAADPGEKQKLREEARAKLTDLVKERPDLRSTVYDQLLSTLPENPDPTTLDPLMLAAIVRLGEQEALKPASETANQSVLEKSLAAATELVKRRGQPGVSDDVADSAALLRGFFLQRLNRNADAATAFTDYLERAVSLPTSNTPQAASNLTLALDNALALLEPLRKANPYDDTVKALYNRLLPIALKPPFSRREMAYDYARQLQRAGRYGDAVSAYRLVPADDKRKLSARYYEMVALKQQLDTEKSDALTPIVRGQMIADVRRLAEDVSAAAKTLADDPNTPADRRNEYRALLARTCLTSADVAMRQESNPARALTVLKDFESIAAGTPDEATLLADALSLRTGAHMDLGQTAEATASLVALLDEQPGGRGADIIYTLLQRLGAELDAARIGNNAARMRSLAAARAALSGHLVTWAANNPNPEIQKYTYRYRVFDAGTQLVAAQLETDDAKRTAELKSAADKYRALLSPDNHKLYVATLPQGADPKVPDPDAQLGLATSLFELRDYAAAQPLLADLLNDRRLGPPQTTTADQVIENDAYWQATYELLRCNVELAKSPSSPPETLDGSKAHLKRLFLQFGPNLGGPKWSAQFESLRKDLIPDFTPPADAGA